MEDDIALAFMFIVDGIKSFKYVIMATIACLVVLYFIWHAQDNDRQACRDKGGVPITTDDGVKCTSGLIK